MGDVIYFRFIRVGNNVGLLKVADSLSFLNEEACPSSGDSKFGDYLCSTIVFLDEEDNLDYFLNQILRYA